MIHEISMVLRLCQTNCRVKYIFKSNVRDASLSNVLLILFSFIMYYYTILM